MEPPLVTLKPKKKKRPEAAYGTTWITERFNQLPRKETKDTCAITFMDEDLGCLYMHVFYASDERGSASYNYCLLVKLLEDNYSNKQGNKRNVEGSMSSYTLQAICRELHVSFVWWFLPFFVISFLLFIFLSLFFSLLNLHSVVRSFTYSFQCRAHSVCYSFSLYFIFQNQTWYEPKLLETSSSKTRVLGQI